MAWRSSGTTNDEMVNNLKRFGVISTPAVEEAFRQVDRAFFVPAADKERAHSDQPLRYGNVHISAPHIYGSVLEALELKPNSSLSFLNVGSGTGYMSCLVATILGSRSNNYGVEIHKDVVEHSKNASQHWKYSAEEPVPDIEWIHGNALQINPDKGEAIVGFDRIYIGASVDKEDLPKLTCLLRPGGILVGPVEDELVKVVRIGSRSNNVATRRNMMEMDNANPFPTNDFTQEVLSGVRFAGLLHRPHHPTVLPSHVWDPSIHHQYPDSFRESCREILLCSKASLEQEPPPVTPKKAANAAGLLPRCVWMEILSFTHRDWFDRPETETEFLRRRLVEEQESAQRARNARIEAETRCRLAEEEKEVYRVLTRRYQLRLEAALRRSGRQEEDEEEGALNGREQAVIYGLGTMLRSIQGGGGDGDDEDDDDIDEEDDDEEVEEEEGQANNELGGMNEDNSVNGNEEMEQEGDEDESESSEEHDTYLPLVAAMSHHASALVGRPQRRTVSITSHDF